MSASNVSQLNDLRSYSRHWLSEFIELYQQEECLWQPKHQDYSNHSTRNKAYDKLVEKLKEVEPNPDRTMVVRKINSLRSAFRREFRKTSTKPSYETRLWYYDKLLFIADQNPKRLSGSVDLKPPKRSLQLAFDDDDSMEFEPDENQMDATGSQNGGHSETEAVSTITVPSGDCTVAIIKDENTVQHHHQQELHQTHMQEQHHANAAANQAQQHTAVKVLEITSLDSNSQREIQQAVNSLEQQHHMQQLQQQSGQTTASQLTQIHQQVPTIQIAREHLQPLFAGSYSTTSTAHHDEYDAIGVNVASKLRGMNAHQRIIAEKLISDVLFNGQLDNLTVNSTLAQ